MDSRTISISVFPQPKMRSVHNAVSDVVVELGMTNVVRDFVEQDPQNPRRWLVTFESMPGALVHSRLHVEILETEGYPAACVLDRRNVGRRVMARIMNKLMDRLDTPPRLVRPLEPQPWGAQPPSPPSRDRRGPPGGDTGRSMSPRTRM